MKWNKEQEAVIRHRSGHLLVSAAAGSGKTAVLVARIVNLLTDKETPRYIDRLLVVTFTRAAAKEMRDRIREALAEALAANPGDRHLTENLNRMSKAQICTIDSFCNALVREFYTDLDVEPDFRILAQEEEAILQNEVMEAVLEEACAASDEDVFDLLSIMTDGKKDDALVDVLRRIYDFSRSYDNPDAWMARAVTLHDLPEELTAYKPLRAYQTHLAALAEAALADFSAAMAACGHDPGMTKILEYLDAWTERMKLRRDMDCFAMQRAFEEDGTFRFPSHRSLTVDGQKVLVDPDRKARVKAIYDRAYAYVKMLKADLSILQREELICQAEAQHRRMATVRRILERFHALLTDEKRRRNAYSFNDVAHMAMYLLVDAETGERTDTARQVAMRFDEIYIDEYQDGNYLQEHLLTAVSGCDDNRRNMVMVGDIKQSIYRFRHAQPEIFNGKYHDYDRPDSPDTLVQLGKNYRSRANILADTNQVFEEIMDAQVGDITYDEHHRLNMGAVPMPEGVPEAVNERHFIIARGAAHEAEATLVANRIRHLVDDGYEIFDRKTGGMRPVRYRDIVILRRSMSTGDVFARVLQDAGIPVFMESKSGFYQSKEIRFITDLLKVIDNPFIDISLCAIIYSDFVGLSSDDLVRLRAVQTEEERVSLYGQIHRYVEEYDDTAAKKLRRFLETLNRLQRRNHFLSIFELLHEIYECLPVKDYFTMLPGGTRRRANLDYIDVIAEDYEKGGNNTITGFLAYLDQVGRYRLDIGEIAVQNEQDDVVRIMTIHKSKGLEFPVVILSGTGGRMQDDKDRVVMNINYGAAMDDYDTTHRTFRDGIVKNILQTMNRKERIGEELRLLYVAMTRAENLLIITGVVTEKRATALQEHEGGATYGGLFGASSMTDFLTMAGPFGRTMYYAVDDISEPMAVRDDTVVAETDPETRRRFLTRIRAALHFDYPTPDAAVKKKRSVSEMKPVPEDDKPIREADEEEKFLYHGLGAEYGTAVHRIMQRIDFQSPERALASMVKRENKDLKRPLRLSDLQAFFETELYRRAAAADARGALFREEKFLARLPDGGILRGMIDAYFIEEDGIVLYDYKTDNRTDAAYFTEHYAYQMAWYRESLERIYNMKVKETWIYSFRMRCAIPVCLDKEKVMVYPKSK
ncbi:MAG: UvrD-helicase domain-containing protein [Eubacteriales bacterium]|nr:UvrD-helicase domain-containing protein [Eubacteriales bacterium]